MATWKKVVVSGSAAQFSALKVDNLTASQAVIGGGNAGNLTSKAISGTGNLIANGASGVQLTGSFTGSFKGDGSQLTGLTPSAVTTYTNSGDNRIITSTTSTGINGEANLTFDGTLLTVTGRADVTGAITGSNLRLDGTLLDGAAEATVLVIDPTGNVKSDEIDTRVWGTTLVDAANGVDNRLATFTDSNSLNGEANLTFDGTTLGVTGKLDVTTSITGSQLMLDGTLLDGAGETTVLVIDGTGNVKSDEIDSRVWGTSLVDGTGLANQVAYWSDSNTVTGDTGFTYNAGTDVLTVGTSTFGTNVNIAGDLFVQGTTVNVNVANLNVEDRFILLNSGSATGDGGIIVQTETAGTGAAFGWYDTAARFSLQTNTKLAGTATAIVPDAFVAAVVDEAASMTDIAAYQKNGNIRVTSGGDIYIYS
jgi:regulator of RNase E activity RraA